MSDADQIPPMPTNPPKRTQNPWKTATLALSAALLATSAGLVGVLSNGDGSLTATPAPSPSIWEDARPPVIAQTAQPSSPTPSPSQSTAAQFKIGEEARNGGAVVTVTKVREADSLTVVDRGEHQDQKAGDGAKYVILETTVLNDTKQSMDLTCGLPIANALLDDQGRRYDTIPDLYKIQGNPECNAQLQPGFKATMQFVYRVPRASRTTAWEFTEFDLSTRRQPSLIQLDNTTTNNA
ncbi:DUF4352 domain-containing protein [Kitasatospora sp. McL0602]|uniref:DUF4352 domain-containing protein n=1 Tax=Kitasatospora sp. McL0602 TaxID=3439530 RepID=UPI003F8C24C1